MASRPFSTFEKTNREIPILAISGAGETGAMNNLNIAMMGGATATLGKPFAKKICFWVSSPPAQY